LEQRQVARAGGGPVAQRRAGAAEGLARPPFGDRVSLLEVRRAGPLLRRRHHFFLATSWSMRLSSISSATSSLRRATSDSSCLTRRDASGLAGLKASRQRW